ncbi:MAG: hypothetical protein JST40_02935 [Armatimonadetes bacterium]|nr:hypothetical protein [Armatimonadota bacterium]
MGKPNRYRNARSVFWWVTTLYYLYILRAAFSEQSMSIRFQLPFILLAESLTVMGLATIWPLWIVDSQVEAWEVRMLADPKRSTESNVLIKNLQFVLSKVGKIHIVIAVVWLAICVWRFSNVPEPKKTPWIWSTFWISIFPGGYFLFGPILVRRRIARRIGRYQDVLASQKLQEEVRE